MALTPSNVSGSTEWVAWRPDVYSRVTLRYPQELVTKNFADKRVATVVSIDDDDRGFTVIIQPNESVLYIDLANFMSYGATYHEWTTKDGWPLQRITAAELRDRKKKR